MNFLSHITLITLIFFSIITVFSIFIFFVVKSFDWLFAISVCTFNSLRKREYSKLLLVAANFTVPFPVKYLYQLKIHIYKHFLMIKLKSYMFFYLHFIERFSEDLFINCSGFLVNNHFMVVFSQILTDFLMKKLYLLEFSFVTYFYENVICDACSYMAFWNNIVI